MRDCCSDHRENLYYYMEKSIIFAKIFRLPVCSVCQYLLLCQRVVQSPQCSLWSIILDNLLGNRRSTRGSRLLPSNCSSTDPPRKSPRGRRSRPFQRGATECHAWNRRIYFAAIIRLRLRRAEVLCRRMGVNVYRRVRSGAHKRAGSSNGRARLRQAGLMCCL